MSKGKKFKNYIVERYFSVLNVKLVLVVLMAGFFAVITLLGMVKFEEYVANKAYLSDSAKKKIVDERYNNLEKYIKKHSVKGTDSRKLQNWLKSKHYTQLLVWDNMRDVFSSGWVVDMEDSKDVQDVGYSVQESKQEIIDNQKNSSKRIGAKEFKEDVFNRYVNFHDGKYYVYINVNKEKYWYKIMDVVAIITTALVFILIIMVYNSMVLKRVRKLSGEVCRISEGELDGEISKGKHDEIGALAESIDNMRNSIVDNMSSEKAAWAANTALITAMSHDIRTPLTSLIGYLDIIDGKKYNSEEEMLRYIKSSREKAIQLKDLSDKLFRYFLVFGNPNQNKPLERTDSGILFPQLLMEHISEAMSKDVKTDMEFDIPEGVMVNVDISLVRRLFDNLFSNILKYADKSFPVEVRGEIWDNKVKITLKNHISDEAKKVESTKIGLKTCRKICQDMHGFFLVSDKNKIYTTEIILPIVSDEEERNVDKGYSEDKRNS